MQATNFIRQLRRRCLVGTYHIDLTYLTWTFTHIHQSILYFMNDILFSCLLRNKHFSLSHWLQGTKLPSESRGERTVALFGCIVNTVTTGKIFGRCWRTQKLIVGSQLFLRCYSRHSLTLSLLCSWSYAVKSAVSLDVPGVRPRHSSRVILP